LNFQQIKDKDSDDRLAHKRDEFHLPSGRIYLNGNSLGPLPRSAKQRARELIERQWGEDLVASWNTHGWIDLPFTAGEKIAALVGAGPEQVLCCDSISINLFKLLAVCLQLQSGRRVVLSQQDNFPTDLYAAHGLQQLLGENRCELKAVGADQLQQCLTEEVAVLFLTHVNFRSGKLHDMQALTRQAQAQGILVVWDLAHSAGVLPLALDAWGVDFAVGCGYKFLNGGPGAPAFIYANRKHHDQFEQPLQGWMGHASPFEFDPGWEPAGGIAQFLTGTPTILSLATLDAALDVFDDIAISDVRAKSTELSSLFLALVESHDELKDLVPESPRDSAQRGSQLAFSHPQAYAICRALSAEGVIADFRSPDLLRVGFSPLILTYEDIWRSVEILAKVVGKGSYKAGEFNRRLKVT
jgi:kynureninase|tara:strand:+ start:9119 stop:10354 length:1236 start_codon:yes stop_codon:yes gene_type:complete